MNSPALHSNLATYLKQPTCTYSPNRGCYHQKMRILHKNKFLLVSPHLPATDQSDTIYLHRPSYLVLAQNKFTNPKRDTMLTPKKMVLLCLTNLVVRSYDYFGLFKSFWTHFDTNCFFLKFLCNAQVFVKPFRNFTNEKPSSVWLYRSCSYASCSWVEKLEEYVLLS